MPILDYDSTREEVLERIQSKEYAYEIWYAHPSFQRDPELLVTAISNDIEVFNTLMRKKRAEPTHFQNLDCQDIALQWLDRSWGALLAGEISVMQKDNDLKSFCKEEVYRRLTQSKELSTKLSFLIPAYEEVKPIILMLFIPGTSLLRGFQAHLQQVITERFSFFSTIKPTTQNPLVKKLPADIQVEVLRLMHPAVTKSRKTRNAVDAFVCQKKGDQEETTAECTIP